jgi:RNA polymerase sigma factor (sigma-70 family)
MEVSALTPPGRITGLHGPSALLRLQSDERLIALTRRGQHAAFEVLCARYQSRLLSFCRHMLGSKEDAEDVLQEVFTAAFNAVLADERDINVRPWLYRIARNRSLNHLRRATAVGVDSMDVHYAEHGVSTGDKVLRRESFRELITDVQHLPETQRTALLLREIDALSYEQIAHAMDTTVPSVKSLLVRARISLADAAQARKLSCDDVRLELGEVAEGLIKLSQPARRHVRDCQRCASFRKQLKDNNHALALILPVGPLLLVKKLLLAKLGTTASAHVAGSAGATVGAGAGAGVAAGAGAAAGSGGIAILTAGAVAADHAVAPARHHHIAALSAATTAPHAAGEPVVVHQALQPASSGVPLGSQPATVALARRHRHHLAHPKIVKAPVLPIVAVTPPTPETTTAPTPPAKPVDPQPVTEVTTQTTELPASATAAPAPSAPTGTPATPPATTTTTGSETQPINTTPPPATTTTSETTTAPTTAPTTETATAPDAENPTTPDTSSTDVAPQAQASGTPPAGGQTSQPTSQTAPASYQTVQASGGPTVAYARISLRRTHRRAARAHR